jgi:hypothetical protein
MGSPLNHLNPIHVKILTSDRDPKDAARNSRDRMDYYMWLAKIAEKEILIQSSSLMSTLATPCMTTPWKHNMLEGLRPGL